MSEMVTETKSTPVVNRRVFWIVLIAALATAAIAAISIFAYRLWFAPAPAAPVQTANELIAFSVSDYATVDGVFCKAPVTGVTRVLTPAQLEEEFGIRIRLVGVTASGGLVDFRYRVVDLAKALPVLGSHESMPNLVDEKSGALLLAPEGMMHHKALEQDRTYFMHYPNAGNNIKPGSQVAVVMGDLRVESVTAQ
ncbi:MAG: hypothetical protein IAE81_14435 [Caldilineaceae bacterium]|jgi:hypothetical protein|nr:hypothetical protein [Caldilineaceae bacterium]